MGASGDNSGVIAVDGAEGFLGSAVVRALLPVTRSTGQGRSVRALVLDPGAEAVRANVPEGAEIAPVPLDDDGALAKALEGVRAIVAARRITFQNPREGLTYRRVHFERATKLLAAAKQAGVERFIYAGLAGADGRSPLAKAERDVKAHVIASSLPALYLNLPMIVGPGDEVVSALVRKANSIWPVIAFTGQGWTRAAPMTREDFAGCVAGLCGVDDFPTGELDLAGPETLSVMDIQDRLLRRAGRRKLKVHVMASVALLGAWIAERIFSDPPVRSSRVAWMLEERVPKRNAAKTLLGRKPDPFERAFPGLGAAAG